MILVIAEKPSLGKDIAAALPGSAVNKDGCIYKGDYVVTWVYGHMLTFKEPEDYDEKYKTWELSQLPIYFDNWGQKIGKDIGKKHPGGVSKKARVKQIGDLLKKADMVINAGDPDEEGQLLVDELLRWFKYKGPVKRLDTGNTVKEALQKALKRMKDNNLYVNEGYSAYARSLADLIVGINMSRYFTIKNKKLLSVGRVQTPTLGLVVARDLSIENHVKTVYYELFADLSIKGKKVKCGFNTFKDNPVLTDGKFLSPDYLKGKEKELAGKSFSDVRISKNLEKEYPPLPFNLVKLQSYCGSAWGYSPSDVMAITQRLREEYKAITYNRSDCQYLSDEHFAEAPGVIAAAVQNLGYKVTDYDSSIKSKCFNSANITAHFAIIPTTKKFDVAKLTEKERNVYTIIANYYLAQFMKPAIKEKTTLLVSLPNGETLSASSVVVKSKGYLELLPPQKVTPPTALSDIPEGVCQGQVIGTHIEEKETKPLSRYTKSTLNEDMTRIAKYVDDPKIKALLLEKDKDKKGENGSIGTSATRSSIIDILIKRGFLAEKGKTLISTDLGRELYRILPDEIKKADLTAKWWAMQEEIRSGEKDYMYLVNNVLDTVNSIIHTDYEQINMSSPAGGSGSVGGRAGAGTSKVIGKCPKCGADVIERDKSFACVNKDCYFALRKEDKFFASQGKKITVTIARGFLSKGKVLVKNLVGRSGRPYEAVIKVDFSGRYPQYTLEFPDKW